MLTALIIAALGGFVGAAMASVFILYHEEIIQWFQQQFLGTVKSPNDVAFSIKEELRGGDYKVIEGIFDQNTEQVKKAKTWNAKQLDDVLRRVHRKDKLAIYK